MKPNMWKFMLNARVRDNEHMHHFVPLVNTLHDFSGLSARGPEQFINKK